MTCEEIDELAGALALGAALPDEVEAVRGHLADCPSAHATLRRMTATAMLLAEAVDEVEPPPHLRDRILAAARADLTAEDATAAPAPPTGPRELRPPPPGTNSRGPRAPAPSDRPLSLRPREQPAETPSATETTAPRPPEPPTRLPARRLRALPAWLAAAAVLVMAVGLGAWNFQLQRELRDRDRDLARQQAQQQDLLGALARGGQLVKFSVATPELAGADGAVLRSAQGQPVVALTGLRRPGEGLVYQLWAIHGNRATDLGIFLPDENGHFVGTLPDLTGADAVAVTVERGREASPTRDPVLVANLVRAGRRGDTFFRSVAR